MSAKGVLRLLLVNSAKSVFLSCFCVVLFFVRGPDEKSVLSGETIGGSAADAIETNSDTLTSSFKSNFKA